MLALLRSKHEADLRDIATALLVQMNQDVKKPKVDAFQQQEPLFCELFWNHLHQAEVEYVPQTYILHLLQRRLKIKVTDRLDEATTVGRAGEFYTAVLGIGFIESTHEEHASVEEAGYRLTKSGSLYLSRKFESTPWYLRLIDKLAVSWRVLSSA